LSVLVALPFAGFISGLSIIAYREFTCQNVTTIASNMRTSLAGVRGGIAETGAELNHARWSGTS
jgi:hypothetical protein